MKPGHPDEPMRVGSIRAKGTDYTRWRLTCLSTIDHTEIYIFVGNTLFEPIKHF